MAKLRVGILGSSFGGAVHAPAFAAHDGFSVVAIASPQNAQAVATERRIPRAFTNLDEMLTNVELDVLSIATPPAYHHDAVMKGLAAGLHIVCEKPMALTVAEAEAMVLASERAQKTCIIAHEFRFLPTRLALGELYRNSHLGAVREIEIVQLGNSLRSSVKRERSWWFDATVGGGIAGAWLSHSIDAANHLIARPPIRVSGLSRTAVRERSDAKGTFTSTAADGAFATLDYGNGIIARLAVDGTLGFESSLFAIHGETRTAVASGSSLTEQRLFTVDDDETAELQLKDIERKALASVHESVPAFTAMLDEFVDAIEGVRTEVATFRDGLDTQRVLAAVGYGSVNPD